MFIASIIAGTLETIDIIVWCLLCYLAHMISNPKKNSER